MEGAMAPCFVNTIFNSSSPAHPSAPSSLGAPSIVQTAPKNLSTLLLSTSPPNLTSRYFTLPFSPAKTAFGRSPVYSVVVIFNDTFCNGLDILGLTVDPLDVDDVDEIYEVRGVWASGVLGCDGSKTGSSSAKIAGVACSVVKAGRSVDEPKRLVRAPNAM